MDDLGRLTVATYCKACGFVRGTPAGENLDRCGNCGRFASTAGVCCAQHELKQSPYPSGECPGCEQERRRQDMIQHEMTRDPQVEPW